MKNNNLLKTYLALLTLMIESIKPIVSYKEYTTLMSPSDGAVEYKRRVSLIEAGITKVDSDSDVSLHSLSRLSADKIRKYDKENTNEIDDSTKVRVERITTTFDPRFVPRVRRPKGYHKNILLNKSFTTTKTTAAATFKTVQTYFKKIADLRIETISTPPPKSSTTPSQSSKLTTTKKVTSKWERPTPYRITPYENYDSSHERAVQKEWPHRKLMMDNIKNVIYMRMHNLTHSYSSESVPSSCSCFAGNWSQSYDAEEEWKKKKHCRPKAAELDYGYHSSEEEKSEMKKLKNYKYDPKDHISNIKHDKISKSSEFTISKTKESKESREYKKQKHSKRKYNKYPPRRQQHYRQQYPIYNQPIVYPPQHMMYQQPMMPPQPMYYPYPMPPIHYYQPQPPPPPPVHYQNGYNDLTLQKLNELQNEIRDMKSTTPKSLWEQYLELKKKFESTPEVTSETLTYNERMQSYRKVEKMEPFYTKFRPMGGPYGGGMGNEETRYSRYTTYERPYRPYSRDIQNEYRRNYEQNLNENLYTRTYYSRSPPIMYAQRERMVGSSIGQRVPPLYRRNYVETTKEPVVVNELSTAARQPLFSRKIYTITNPQNKYADIRWSVPGYNTAIVKSTLKPVEVPVKPVEDPVKPVEVPVKPVEGAIGDTTTTGYWEAYKAYKDKYEFPDYLSEKRRLYRENEKKLKRVLYAAKGMVYDEDPPRSTTRPPPYPKPTPITFSNYEAYFKYLFDDKSIPVDTTVTPKNKAPTFNTDTDEGKMAYLKWLLSDKSIDIDPL